MVHTVEELHQKNLGITLSTVTRLRLPLFRLLANLDHNDIRHDVTLVFIETGVDLAVVELFTSLAERLARQCRWVHLWINSENVQNDLRGGTVISATNNHTVTNDEDQLSLVVILQSSERVETLAKIVLTLSVSRNHADDELVLGSRATLGT
jgi:hypothetical protein